MDYKINRLLLDFRSWVIDCSEICSHCTNAYHLEFQKEGKFFTEHIFECKIKIDSVVHCLSNEISRVLLQQFLKFSGFNGEQAYSMSRNMHPFWFCPLYYDRVGDLNE